MKIQQKKLFFLGLAMGVLAVLHLVTGIQDGFDGKKGVMMVTFFILAVLSIARSLSPLAPETAARNQEIQQKARSKAVAFTQVVTFVLAILCFLAARAVGEADVLGLISIGTGLFLACVLSLLAELFAVLYYEKHC